MINTPGRRALLAAAIIVLAVYVSNRLSESRKFDSHAWKDDAFVATDIRLPHIRSRWSMLDDLVARHSLYDMTPTQLCMLLGPDHRNHCYSVPPETLASVCNPPPSPGADIEVRSTFQRGQARFSYNLGRTTHITDFDLVNGFDLNHTLHYLVLDFCAPGKVHEWYIVEVWGSAPP